MIRRLVLLGTLLTCSCVEAAGFPGAELLDPNQLGSAIPQAVANEAMLLVGSYAAHRPYSGAVSIQQSNFLDFGIETTLVKMGDGLPSALQANGISAPTTSLPSLPMIKAHLRKGLSPVTDFGISALTYRQQSVYGADLKTTLIAPEEGPSLAIRLLYTWISLPLLYIERCTVIAPELVVSQPLSFAESWIGIGGRWVSGTMKATVSTTVGAQTISTDLRKTGSQASGYAFTGVRFRIPGATGLRLGIEGSFDLAGYSTLGTFIGAGF
jgi:hypothetical protein